jgi:hypothetical protein
LAFLFLRTLDSAISEPTDSVSVYIKARTKSAHRVARRREREVVVREA